MIASTASAKAMSVAVGMAQPGRRRRRRASTRGRSRAGTTTPPTAAATGTAAGRVAQVARDELALELEPGDEEEDGEQAVGRPGAQREVQVQRLGPDAGVAQLQVGVAPREFAQTRAIVAPASSRAPPTVSLRSTSAMRAVSGHEP